MDYKRIYRIAAKIILSDTFTEEQWKKYHEEHPRSKRENHTIIPSTPSTSHEEGNIKHPKKDKLKDSGVRRLLRTLHLYLKKRKKLQKRVYSGHEYITPNNIRSADNGIDDARKIINQMREEEDIVNKNNGASVHITANDEDELIHCCMEESKHNMYQITSLITSNIDTIFENSVYVMRNKSKPLKEKRNKSKGRSVFLFTEIYNGACKVNKRIFSVIFTIGVSRFYNPKTKKEELKRRLYHFRIMNIKKLLPPMGKLIPGIHFGSRVKESSIKNWEKAKKNIVDLGEIEIAPSQEL